MGRRKTRIQKECPICKKMFETPPSQNKTFCTKKCMGIKFTAENNPNYGNYWSDEQKYAQSLIIKSKVTEDYKKKAGSANRGKRFSSERVAKMHSHRSRESYSRPHTEYSKRLIGIKSKEKFTDEYKKRQKELFVKRGLWIDDSQKSDIEVYKKLAHWKYKMWDIVTEGIDKLKTHGIFNPHTNSSGCVRDHKFSKTDGFLLGVFPEIIRHPRNCKILTHSENSSKGKSSSITLDELFSSIEDYKGNWHEHSRVLKLIKLYKDGQRADMADYKGGDF